VPLPRSSAIPGDVPRSACPEFSLYDDYGGRFLDRPLAWSSSGRHIAVRGAKAVVVVDVRTRRRSVVRSTRSGELGLAWSPRGRNLAAFTENEIFIGVPPRPLRRIARGCFGAWGPSGRRFAFTADGWAQTANADGSQRRRVTRAAAVTDWSPEGRRLLLLRSAAGEQCRTSVSRAYVLRLGVQSPQPLSEHRFRTGEYAGRARGDQVAAVFSPDGWRVSWSEGPPCGIAFAPPGPWGPRTYVAGKTRSVGLGYATWSPSSRLLALEGIRTCCWSAEPVVVEPGGRLVRELRGTGAFSWSPDGSSIAFDRNDGNLYVARPDVPSSERLLVRSGRVPAWSPDGSKIAFLRSTERRPCLSVVSVRGGAPRKLLGC
jgi:hypothetical protein